MIDDERDRSLFLMGERIKLCSIRPDDVAEWASWFNSSSVTKYLEQGIFPNSEADQEEFIRSAREAGRFLAMVRSVSTDALLGVISLSQVDDYRRSAQIALVMPIRCPGAPFGALEAMARVVEHGMQRMRLERIWAGQAYPDLARWNSRLELIGFKTEGVNRSAFVHGSNVGDSVSLSVIASDFDLLTERRGGTLWPGSDLVERMTHELASSTYEPVADRLSEFLVRAHLKANEHLASLENSLTVGEESSGGS